MRRFAFSVMAVTACLSATVVLACSVPVFRYALERWQPDNFQLIVFQRGELNHDHQALIEVIEPSDRDADYVANIEVRTVNLDEATDPALLDLWSEHAGETLPWAVALSPAKSGKPAVVATGAFARTFVDPLLGSPKRTEITNRLLKGDSVVWVLLECGDPDADEAAAQMLESELTRLEKELKLPEIEEADIQQGYISIDPKELKLKFSMVRLARDEVEEQALVEMLLATEPDLHDAKLSSQPMALPVFGRARSLYALVGEGINAQMIEVACRFLTAACQCRVKAQNPGADLLTTIDWDSAIPPSIERDTAPPPLVGLAGFGRPNGEERDNTESTAPSPGAEESEKTEIEPTTNVDSQHFAENRTRETATDSIASTSPRTSTKLDMPLKVETIAIAALVGLGIAGAGIWWLLIRS